MNENDINETTLKRNKRKSIESNQNEKRHVIESLRSIWYQSKLNGRTVIGHGGSDKGVATTMAFSPDTGYGVIILMNVSWTDDVTSATDELQELLIDRAESR